VAREVRLWEWLRDGLKGTPLLDLHRVENMVGSGTPDVEGCFDGDAFMLELKGALRPARPATPVRLKFQPMQPHWLTKRWTCGGAAWVYVRVGEKREIARYLFPGYKANLLQEGITEEVMRQHSVLLPYHSQTDLLERARQRRDYPWK
jgi:hypothetical protein